VAALEAFVRELLGKKPSRDKLYRKGKLVTNKQKIVDEVKRLTAKAEGEADKAKAEAKQAKAEGEKAKKELAEIKKLEATLAKAKSTKRDDEPTPEQIKEVQEFDYDDDNVVRLENFNKAYLNLQRQKVLKKKIAALLHAEGLRQVEVIIRQMAEERKAAA
jgi:hypothetical protein